MSLQEIIDEFAKHLRTNQDSNFPWCALRSALIESYDLSYDHPVIRKITEAQKEWKAIST